MLEAVRNNILKINLPLFKVIPRNSTSVEMTQISSLAKYTIWGPLSEGKTAPRPFNSLSNPALRRNAPNLIPKKIHQIWLSDLPPSGIRVKLHETLK